MVLLHHSREHAATTFRVTELQSNVSNIKNLFYIVFRFIGIFLLYMSSAQW
jgi:hypothetical protein